MTQVTDRQKALHVLRCASMPGTDGVADRTGLSPDRAAEVLGELEADGHVRHRERPKEMWMLLPSGREEHAAWIEGAIEERANRDRIHEQYQAFLGLNERMLQLCNDWQMREQGGEPMPNDHTDADYDAAVLDRLGVIDSELRLILAVLAQELPWASDHAARFDHALAQLEAGEHAWLTGVTIPSYHTVWFELHEELLSTLGISREEESQLTADAAS